MLLVVGTVSDILKAPAAWQHSEGLVHMTARAIARE
jgi:hypothetical protein